MRIPAEYHPIMPYLILKDAQGFLDFAKAVFGATEQLIVPGDAERSIMHGEIRLGDGIVMFAQAGQWQEKPAGMFVYVENLDQVYQDAQNHNAKILVEPSTEDYGYTAGFEDPFGNQWWITQAEKE